MAAVVQNILIIPSAACGRASARHRFAIQKASISAYRNFRSSTSSSLVRLSTSYLTAGRVFRPIVCNAEDPRTSDETTSDETKSDKTKQINTLVVGGGGREHALCYALSLAPSCDLVFCAPGNAGIDQSGDATCLPDLDVSNSSAVIDFCKRQNIGLVIIGPEAPLVAGLADDLASENIPTFGPSAEAAQLEGSKTFMKQLCDKYNIPTAKYASFTDPEAAKAHIRKEGAPIVVKADGLAAGKGVVVAKTVDEALDAVDAILVNRSFGSAGGVLVVEEFLEGEEVSFFALVDGQRAKFLASAQDHKPVGDGDTGPNTGGMGAYSPAPVLTESMERDVMESIIEPTVRGMTEEGCPFVGVLYAGLMVDPKSLKCKLLEYNVRFGDPECQVLMMRLKSDLAQALLAAAQGRLGEVHLDWSPDSSLVVVLAARGYPGPYQKGSKIRHLTEAEGSQPGAKIFHAGTVFDGQREIVAAGGRVLGVTAVGSSVAEAQKKAYLVVDKVEWEEGFCRRDIGWRAVEREKGRKKK